MKKIKWKRIQVNNIGFDSSRYYIAEGCPTIYYTGYGYVVYELKKYGCIECDDMWFLRLKEAKEFVENLFKE